MINLKLLTLLAVILNFVASVGCSREELRSEPGFDKLLGRTSGVMVDELVASCAGAALDSKGEVQRVIDRAAASEQAILCVSLDWSMMQPQRKRFAEFMIEYKAKNPNRSQMF